MMPLSDKIEIWKLYYLRKRPIERIRFELSATEGDDVVPAYSWVTVRRVVNEFPRLTEAQVGELSDALQMRWRELQASERGEDFWDQRANDKDQQELGQEPRATQLLYEETPHKQKMRELAVKVATEVSLPMAFGSFIEERKPGFWFIGKGFPINISEAGEVEVYLEYKGGDLYYEREHLYEGLFSHLRVGGFSDVLDKITDWEQKAPKILVESHELLNMIKKDIEKRHNVTVSIDDTVQTGFTPDFLKTVYMSAIFGMKEVDASSWYELRGLNLRRGVYWIYRGLPNEDLETYRDTHIELIGKYVVTDLAKHIGEQSRELREIERNIKQRLERFADMERLPGWCELCS